MRRVVLPTTAALALLASGAAAASARTPSCGPNGERLRAHTAQSAVFRVHRAGLVGCTGRRGAHYKLPGQGHEEFIRGRFVFRGRFVSYRYVAIYDEASFELGVVFDLLTGDVRSSPADPEDFALSSSGKFVWIEGGTNPQGSSHYFVRKTDADGQSVLLAEGGDIEPQSLHLTDDAISWKQGGTVRQARFARGPARANCRVQQLKTPRRANRRTPGVKACPRDE